MTRGLFDGLDLLLVVLIGIFVGLWWSERMRRKAWQDIAYYRARTIQELRSRQ